MALTQDTPRRYAPNELVPKPEVSVPVRASSVIYAGSAVSQDSDGNHRALNTSDDFAGFARKGADNGSGSAGDVNVAIYTEGEVELPLASITGAANINAVVYASDDNTFTLTAGSNVPIGRLVQIVSVSDNIGRVRFKGLASRDHTNPEEVAS